MEVWNRLKPDRIDIVPCGVPAHKSVENLLPFELRVKLLKKALAHSCFKNIPIRLETLENERKGPSYTYDTLVSYQEREKDSRLYFLLGAPDFLTLPTWHRGLELPNLADFILFPRSGAELKDIRLFIQAHWESFPIPVRSLFPNAAGDADINNGTEAFGLGAERAVLYLPVPRLDVSGSMIRRMWRDNRCISFLVPPGVEKELEKRSKMLSKFWTISKDGA